MRERSIPTARHFRRAAIAGTASLAMLAGATAPAIAAPIPDPAPAVADAIARAAEAVPGAEALLPGQRTKIGEHLGQTWLYEFDMFKQIMGPQNVVAGQEITVRVEVEATGSQGRVGALTDVMPAGFELKSVVFNPKEGAPQPLTPEQYATTERTTDAGALKDTRVDFAGNGIGRVHVGTGKVSVDFTYVAPKEARWYENGAGMEVSAGAGSFPKSTRVDSGAPSIQVVAPPVIPGLPGGATGSIDWGSLNIGGAGSSK